MPIKINTACGKANAAFDKAREKIQQLQQQYSEYTGIVAAIENAKDKVTAVANLMPPSNLSALNDATIDLQSGLRGLQINSSVLTNNVIIRK